MRNPSIATLPSPPPGRSGWPWSKQQQTISTDPSNDRLWPRVSVVTPSYNQGRFIEETIRSVLLQGYPNLEYIIIDGGSTDDTVDIIRKYQDKLAYWVSERDRGQAHAINKGFDRATGDIFAWINSDDYYYPGAFSAVGHAFSQYPEISLVHGYEHYVDEDGEFLREVFPPFKNAMITTLYFAHPLLQVSCFWRADAYHSVGGLDEKFDYHLDYDLLLRLSYKHKSMYIPQCIGAFRRYPEQKCRPELGEQFVLEHRKVIEKFLRQENVSAWNRHLLGCWLRMLLGWRYAEDSGLLRVLKRSLHHTAMCLKGGRDFR